MSGTKEGGLKAVATNKSRHGENFYAEIGKKGGMNGHTGGFAANRELARKAGAKGGKISRRGQGIQKKLDEIFAPFITEELEKGSSIHYIAKKIGVSDSTIKKYCLENNLSAKFTDF